MEHFLACLKFRCSRRMQMRQKETKISACRRAVCAKKTFHVETIHRHWLSCSSFLCHFLFAQLSPRRSSWALLLNFFYRLFTHLSCKIKKMFHACSPRLDEDYFVSHPVLCISVSQDRPCHLLIIWLIRINITIAFTISSRQSNNSRTSVINWIITIIITS